MGKMGGKPSELQEKSAENVKIQKRAVGT